MPRRKYRSDRQHVVGSQSWAEEKRRDGGKHGSKADWTCTSCGTAGNWASRSSCRRCGFGCFQGGSAGQCKDAQAKELTALRKKVKELEAPADAASAVDAIPPAKAAVQSLEAQLAAVDACIKVAQGEHLQLQQAARDTLQKELDTARSAHRAADPSARKAVVQKQLAELAPKLEANRELLVQAQSEVAKFEGYIASQSAKQRDLEAELRTISVAEVSAMAPLDQAHAALLQQLADVQRQLAGYKHVAAPPPTGGTALALEYVPPSGDAVDVDFDLCDDAVLDSILGIDDDAATEPASVKRRADARAAMAKAKRTKGGGAGGVLGGISKVKQTSGARGGFDPVGSFAA